MTGVRRPETAAMVEMLETAHRLAVQAATNGLQDPGLGAGRLTGDGIAALAEAAVSSATPFVRAPLLGRLADVLDLHPPEGGPDRACPSCRVAAPCATAQQAGW